MDIQGLKDKILQLAIRGKLVEQDKNDEPASALVQRIKEERDKLVKEGKIRKPKKLESIEEEEKPFEIPEGWEWVRFQEVLDVRDGTHDTPKYVDTGIPLITSKNLVNGEINFDDIKFISIEDHKKISERSNVENEDILFAMIGSIGNPVIVNENLEFSIKNVALFKYYKKGLITPKYLYYYLLFVQEDMKKQSSGGVQSFISLTFLRNYIFPLPSLAEQKRIVEKVDELFALIDELDSNKEDLLEVINLTRNQVLQEAIQGKLVEQNPEDEPASVLLERIMEERDNLVKEGKIKKQKPLPEITEEEKPFKLPEGWEWVRLGEVAIINPRNSFEDEKQASFVPMALIEEGFKNNHTSETKLWKDIKKGFTHFAENDVAVAKITPCFENKKSVIMQNLVNGIGAGTTELHIIRSINRLVIPEYILSICKTDRFIKDGVSTYTGTAGQQRISKDFIMNYLIPLPPLAEQKRIVEKVDEIMNMLDELENEIVINI
ncbi:restriction endonuclease subunit S [Tissierella pigra]|uniref:restriction endonuclease subunit S n=1 Tax=Tissierella pigra TaxID=2607614 RepID=UPI001C127506|nr:restriction endonuclease subunit S [Tissierella pigra]MBU5428194.1 restriction endonuclease subunit S [Tissierella pigra]